MEYKIIGAGKSGNPYPVPLITDQWEAPYHTGDKVPDELKVVVTDGTGSVD